MVVVCRSSAVDVKWSDEAFSHVPVQKMSVLLSGQNNVVGVQHRSSVSQFCLMLLSQDVLKLRRMKNISAAAAPLLLARGGAVHSNTSVWVAQCVLSVLRAKPRNPTR